jgi:hypothetical protein
MYDSMFLCTAELESLAGCVMSSLYDGLILYAGLTTAVVAFLGLAGAVAMLRQYRTLPRETDIAAIYEYWSPRHVCAHGAMRDRAKQNNPDKIFS